MPTSKLTFDYDNLPIGKSRIIHADCLEWLGRVPENTLHAIVTDPPYGVKEYDFDGGRIGGHERQAPSPGGRDRQAGVLTIPFFCGTIRAA